MRGFIKRLTSIVLAIAILFTSSIAGAQRTGGSFGGSSWGSGRSSSSSSYSRPSSTSTYRSSSTFRRSFTRSSSTPTYRTSVINSPRRTSPGGGVVIVNTTTHHHHDDGDDGTSFSFSDNGDSEPSEPWGTDEWICFIIFAGIVLGVIAAIVLHGRYSNRRRYY
jgi:hypothetical protein